MKKTIAFFKLIRWNNLAIIAFTQLMLRYMLIDGMLRFMKLGIILQLSHTNFLLLMLSTLCIAAAGYIINDYFDQRIDHFNKPQHVVVGKLISRREAMLWHSVLNVLGVILGFYVAYRAGVIKLGLINLICSGLLWFYSTEFKKKLFIGNLVISLLTAMVPMVVVLYDLPVIYAKYRTLMQYSGVDLNHILVFVSAFSGFAFLTTLIREIVKDMEDAQGDSEFGCITLPIRYGIPIAKKVCYLLIGIEILLLFMVQLKQLASLDTTSFLYFGLLLQLPLVYTIYLIRKALAVKDYHHISRTIKFIMLSGVLYCAVYYYLLLY